MQAGLLARAAGWCAYRRLRRVAFSLAGRNPLVTKGHSLTIREEWNSVTGLTRSLEAKPHVESKTGDSITWQTAMGKVVTPAGAGEDYIGRLTAEMPSSVYRLSKDDRVVLDAGGNIGLFSLYAFRCGAERVIAFEPSPGNAACLLANLDRYHAQGRLTLIPKGVWSHEATLRFNTRNTNNPGGHSISDDGDIEVPVTAIDSIVRDLQLSRVDYLKMDVEGSELKALDGARETIERFRPRCCIATEHTEDLYENTEAVIDAMKRYGYDYTCTEAHPYHSPSRGWILTPYCLLFRPLPN